MLLFFILHSFINFSFQEEDNQMFYVLPKENQIMKGVIRNFDEKIQNTQSIGFGLWFKWQPLALKEISNTNIQCFDQFIFQLENEENKQQIYILYLRDYQFEHKLNVISDFFTFQEDISLGDYYEGVWVFFNSFFDFSKKSSTFFVYQTLNQELTTLKIDVIPIFQDFIQYQIGNICYQCTSEQVICFSPFQGRLSILFEWDNFDESIYQTQIQNYYSLINDCVEMNKNSILGSQIYDGDFYTVINLGILEKLYFQINGWVKIVYDQSYFINYNIIKIVNNFIENQLVYDITIQCYYFLQQDESKNGIVFTAFSDTKLSKRQSPMSYAETLIQSSILKQWHFIQLDVGYLNKAGTFKLYSNQLNEVLELQFYLNFYTGIKYGLYIGGDTYSDMYLKGTITDLVFKTFCMPSEKEFIVKCHYTCQTYNCLTCKSGSLRILKNDLCICEGDAFQFQEQEICQTIDSLFDNLIILEEELPCKLEGYDQCDDTIMCSFGYFNYQGKQCIQCPFYNLMSSNSDILCFNCLNDPAKFSIILTCTSDLIQYNQEAQNTYDTILRNEDNFQFFEIKQFYNKFSLHSKQNKIYNIFPFCKKGFYYQNDECYQCIMGCIICKTSNMCSQCEGGYYLDNNQVCSKCQNCLTCELKKEQQICLSCPQQFYLKNEQCFSCGQFCADCRSNGYCNYCIDSQQYFISIDGINCLICNISNCKYCYQIYDIDLQIFYTSFVLYLENYPHDKQTRDNTIYCAKCQEGCILDLNTNTCIKQFIQTPICQFGYFSDDKSNLIKCEGLIYETDETSCNSIRNCKYCLLPGCIECQKGFYVDILTQDCQRCPVQCENCILQSKRFMDSWKIEIQPRYRHIKLKSQTKIFTNFEEDYEIQCTSCPPNYILYNSICIEGCNEDCLKCEIISGLAKCVECKPFNNKIVKSLKQNGQCLRCQQNCEQCGESSINHLDHINRFFIFTQENSIYTTSCYRSLPNTNERKIFVNQFSVIDCEKFNKCKRRGIFVWNIYCDMQEFQNVQNKGGFFQQGNYYFNDFFESEILGQVEINNLISFLNEQLVEQIDIIINIFQGNEYFCKPLKNKIEIRNTFIEKIFFFKGVNLKISGKQQNVFLEEFSILIAGFTQIQFENLNFKNNLILITGFQINSISFTNCSFGNDSPIITQHPHNLYLINVTIQFTYVNQDSQFLFDFGLENFQQKNTSIMIEGLRIINSKFQQLNLITIIANIYTYLDCQINKLEILESEFENSLLFASFSSSGAKNKFFGNLVINQLNLKNVNLKNSTLFYTPNVLLLNIDSVTIENIKFQSNSYLLLSNQLNLKNCCINQVVIDQSYLFSNNVSLIYQTSFSDLIKIYFNEIIIKNVIYTQEQALLQILKYNNYEMLVELNNFQINYVSPRFAEQNSIMQEKSIIHISCTQCYINLFEIHRQNGYPEISIIDSQSTIISNSIFTQNQEQTQIFNYDCNKEEKNYFQHFIYIGQYQKVKIDNLTIIDAISVNYPFIIIQGFNVMYKQFIENIEIINSKFENNRLITQVSNSPTSIIQIDSKQKSIINLINLQFRDNHLNMEIKDLITHSSSTLIIDTQVGIIFMNNCLFEQNIVTNSSDSILYMKAEMVEIINSKYIKNNILNFSNILNRIQQVSQGNKINSYEIQQVIQILSNGGSGYFLTKYFSLKNCIVSESYSLYGGAFYVNTFGDASILIENSTFLKTSSSLQSSASSAGGCFYIDAQVSKLTLLVKNSIFNQSFSRSQGGCFFILPSNSQNFVNFEQIKIINAYSITSQFFEYSLQNLKNIISNVTFYDIQIIYDQIVYNKFLGLLDNLSTDQAAALLNNDQIINVKYGNLTVHKVHCKSESKIFLIAMDEGQIINLIQISIENGFIRNSPFMSLNLKSSFQGSLKIQNITLNNIQEFQEMKNFQQCEEISTSNLLQQFCISPIFFKNNIILEDDMEIFQYTTLCQNENLILQQEKSNFSLIGIFNIKTNHKVIIEDIFLNKIICKNCQNGILSLTNIEQSKQDNIILNEIILKESYCGITGCLTIINKNSINFLKTNYLKQESRILQQQNWEQLKSSFSYQVSLSNSNFFKNKADYGGAICVIDINILINQCQFLKNTAKIGGAIYSFTSEQQNYKIVIFASILIDNQADLAANIYLENQMLQQTKKLNIILEKNMSTPGNIVQEKPRSLALSTKQGSLILLKKVILSSSTKVIEKTIINPYTIIGLKEKVETLLFPSGQIIGEYYYFDVSTSTNIRFNLSLRIIALNMLNQKEVQLNGSICTLRHKVINITDLVEIDDPYVKLSIYSVTFNSTSLDFNLDNLIVYFNPHYDKEIVLRLFIQCDMIQIPIYDENPPFLIKNYITDYELFVDIKTFPCQLGEYFNSTSKICIKCNSDQSQYQVEQNATICSIKDETRINSVESEKIELKPNFWRAYFYSTKIEVCYHLLENCLGGWYPGDKSCALGHIGALCEQCDLYNIRGDGHFSTSSPYKCSNCDQIEGNVITISLISLWTLISVLMSVNSTIDTINQFIAGTKLILFGVSNLLQQSSTAVLIKVFTNYLQIIQTISTFQLKVPSGLSQIFTSVGNPIEQVAYSLDCFLMQLSDISIIYFRIIWSFLMAISYVSTFFLILAVGILLKQIKFNISMITTALIYIFIFLQPNIIQSLISLVSFRTLSNVDWVQGNVAYRYDTSSHSYWLISFCLPILITFSLLIPLLMFYRIRSNRNHLHLIRTRETWGYLYNEYKLKAYYWEFVKIFQKELIIIFLAYYEDYIAIKAALVFLVIFAYSFMSTSVSPYMTGELNRFDTQSTTVCAISIILGSSIYTAQNQNFIEIVYPFYIIIALINGWFLIKMIINILLAYFDKLHEQIDKVKEVISLKFSDYLSKCPKVKKFLESKKKKLQRIQSRFAKIKQYLIPKAQKIIKLKNNTPPIENDYPLFTKKIDQIIQTENTIINRYPKPQNFQLKPKIQIESDSQIQLEDQ